jgi:hypothetical protein
MLVEILNNHPELIDTVNTTHPLNKATEIRKFIVGDFYFSESIWAKPLSIKSLKEILSWNNGARLDTEECMDLYNQWFIPIWNILSSTNNYFARTPEQSMDGDLAVSKGELLEIFWTIRTCLSIPELNFGIILTPIHSRK